MSFIGSNKKVHIQCKAKNTQNRLALPVQAHKWQSTFFAFQKFNFFFGIKQTDSNQEAWTESCLSLSLPYKLKIIFFNDFYLNTKKYKIWLTQNYVLLQLY